MLSGSRFDEDDESRSGSGMRREKVLGEGAELRNERELRTGASKCNISWEEGTAQGSIQMWEGLVPVFVNVYRKNGPIEAPGFCIQF